MKNLVGNKVTEKDIRDWLSLNDFDGQVAKISNLELFAIARPGWKQLFCFDLIAKPQSREKKLNESLDGPDTFSEKRYWGVVLDDERIKNKELKTQVWLYDSTESQQAKLAKASIGMIARNRSTDSRPLVFLSIAAAIFLLVVCLASWLF